MRNPNLFLYDRLDTLTDAGVISKEIPDSITQNLNPNRPLSEYQTEAFARFIYCFENSPFGMQKPLHLLFKMATGSGKTLIMAGLILYLYEQGYRNFLFFVNSKNIIEKTKDNFINADAPKFLFNKDIRIQGQPVSLTEVDNFEDTYSDDINICFSTIQQLHIDMNAESENALTPEHFADKQIVLLSDEAHHMNVRTRSQSQTELFNSWEDTVKMIFTSNKDNLLLEFTATHDYEDGNIVEEYRDKVLYRYDLKDYREDKFSKEIEVVRSDFSHEDRILQAVILSWYKQQVAEKYNIPLKPVILFKSQRSIEQSQENKTTFHDIIDTLTESDIERILESKVDIVQRAFQFFNENGITAGELVQRLKTDFQPNYCLSVNDDKQAERNQILVNNLEKENNPIRAVFAVQKLNEGWDVLNLFDIVRCYETRDTRSNRPGKTTIAEAQLIGRGARYFPFTLPENDDEYRRKFDNDTVHELRVLEELHYHSVNNPRYISEIRTALIDEGLMDENTKERPITLKASFKDTDFYEKGVIWINKREKRGYQHVQSFDDLTTLNIKQKNHPHTIYEGGGGVTTILDDTDTSYTTTSRRPGKDILITQIEKNIVFEAIARNPFYRFDNLKQYFPHLRSMQEFRKSEDYLGGLAIEFKGDLSRLKTNPAEKLRACCDLLQELENELQKQITEYVGTTTFQPHEIKAIFLDKTLKFGAHHASVNYTDNDFDQIVRAEEWFAFDGVFYGTSDERGLVKLLSRWWNDAQNTYETFYLIRNENHFCICNFSNGDKFYPDFVMFLRKKNGETLTYEVFVEPKGTHLQKIDQWKEDFLKKIRAEADTQVIAENRKYRILGVGRFYNQDIENEFKDELNETLQQGTS